MSFGHGELHTLSSDEKLVQFQIGLWHEIEEPYIQTTGSYSFQLFQTRCRLKLQFRVGLLLPESPERIRNNTAPGRILGEPDAQGARLTASRTSSCLTYFLKDAPSIFQK